MHRFILDNDGSNFFLRAMSENIEECIIDAVGRCPASVTTYMLCPGAGTYLYPTRVGEVIAQTDMFPASKYLRGALEQGVDPFGMFLEALRKAGKETFITLRMNDVHNPNDPTDWNTPRFRKEHPDLAVDVDAVAANTDDWLCYCLDYSRCEVRDYFLAIIRELVEMYDVDGLQLDWMRFPRHLSGSSEEVWQKRCAITEFVSCARGVLNSSGKDILLSARIPTSLRGCRHVGLDIAEWTRLGLVDFLTAAPFLTTDFAMSIRELRAELGSNPVPMYGGIECEHSDHQSHCPESLRAAALGIYDSGADGVNVFNFPCWNEYLASIPYHWLVGMSDSQKCKEKPLLFSVTHSALRLGVDLPGQLPATLPIDAEVHLALHIPHAALPAKSVLVLVHSHGDVSLSVNGQETTDMSSTYQRRSHLFVEFIDPNCAIYKQPRDEDCRVFRVHHSQLKPGTNDLSISNRSRDILIISRVNMGVW